MRRWHTRVSPPALRRSAGTVDNVALLPASLLPHKSTYQAIANRCPRGTVLIILPNTDTPERRLLQHAADHWLARGRTVTTITEHTVLAWERRGDR